jgi:hypothetical protein
MKQMKLLILIFLLAFFLVSDVHAQVSKMAKVGKLEARVYDHGCQSQNVFSHSMITYYRGSYCTFENEYQEDWPGGLLKNSGMFFGVRNWVDTLGGTWEANVTGHNTRLRDVTLGDLYQMNVPDDEGIRIRRTMRYPLPVVTTDGDQSSDPFPTSGDFVDPAYIDQYSTSADVMIESNIRLSIGIDGKQRVFAWSQPDHDDYVIWDWTFVNTGNVDLDDSIELPNQTLDSLVICRVVEAMPNGTGNNKSLATYAGVTEDDDTGLSYPGQGHDSLRIDYMTPLRAGNSDDDSYGIKVDDNQPDILTGARWGGEAVLFAPQNTSVSQAHPIADFVASNDPAQPSMHATLLVEPSWMSLHNGQLADISAMTPEEHVDCYGFMRKGIFGVDPSDQERTECSPMSALYDVYDVTATGCSTYYELPIERWGERHPDSGYVYCEDIGFQRFDQQMHQAIGPYQMGFGDTIRYVYAPVGGAISRKTSYLLGEAWDLDSAVSYGWLEGLDSATMVAELRGRDPIFDVYYGLGYFNTPLTLNDVAKDLMVATGKDSMFINGMSAQRNFKQGYNIPKSPAPPSVFAVNSRSDMIRLDWSYQSSFGDYTPTSAELEMFKIYRALGGNVFQKEGSIITGNFVLIDSVDATVREYQDMNVTPAVDYYYYITAVSPTGIESGRFLTMTQFPARLKEAPDSVLANIRVVPNPLNVNSVDRFDEDALKIVFFNLPGNCTIHILTESGKLVRKIEHNDGSGTEPWYVDRQYMLTDSYQIPASGLYIAYIQDNVTGESISRKFAIIR